LSTVKNLGPLIKIVHGSIELEHVPKKSKIFNHINCETLFISSSREIYTDADIENLNEVLNDKVEMFAVREGSGHFQFIKKYDGKGKCNYIQLEYENGDYKVKQKDRNQFYLESKKNQKMGILQRLES